MAAGPVSFVRIGLKWLEQAVVHAGRTLLAWIPMPHCSSVNRWGRSRVSSSASCRVLRGVVSNLAYALAFAEFRRRR